MTNVVAAGAIFASLLLLTACQESSAEVAEAHPRPVLSTVAELSHGASLTLPGVIHPRVETKLAFRILGRIVSRNVEVGDLVRKDDIIATIDPLALEFALKSAQSDLTSNKARLDNAISNEKRQRALLQLRSGTKAKLEVAEQQLSTADAAVARAQANVEKTAEQLAYAQLHAEFDGVVTATSAEVGQVVAAGQDVATIARLEQREAVLDVPELEAARLKPGAVFNVNLQLNTTVRAVGVVREIAPEADQVTRTRRTKLTLVNPPDALRLGVIINATLVATEKPAVRLPSSALGEKDGTHFVWVIDETAGKVARRTVKVAAADATLSKVTIVDGVKPGERVAVAGVNSLHDGQAIRIDQEIRQ